MPNAPKRHATLRQQSRPKENRLSPSERGYGSDWIKCANAFIDMEIRAGRYFCACGCGMSLIGLSRRKINVDHKKPFHGIDDPLRLDLSNLQCLFHRCHSKKTASRDGGFGN